ncbi:hypothetical protein ACINWC743_0257 [Acinetobacter sp. WC-743]|nr:hypothetical protein ACINWC743_0257 [Acinetobacter sp. WC-743]
MAVQALDHQNNLLIAFILLIKRNETLLMVALAELRSSS